MRPHWTIGRPNFCGQEQCGDPTQHSRSHLWAIKGNRQPKSRSMNDDVDFRSVIPPTYYLIAAVLIVFSRLSWSFFLCSLFPLCTHNSPGNMVATKVFTAWSFVKVSWFFCLPNNFWISCSNFHTAKFQAFAKRSIVKFLKGIVQRKLRWVEIGIKR
jgi:hypothetical protein